MAITIEMPRLSDSMHEGIVLRWVKKIGDFVEVGDHLADIETDKAHVELQACEDGTLMEILVPEGGSAAVGAPIALLQSEFGAASCDCPPCPPVKCSPLAARLAAEAGLNAGTLRGTGPRGKIMAADVRASIRPADGPACLVQTPLAPRDTRHATRVDNFYLYSLEANMAYLAAISTPIAVQCEKLIAIGIALSGLCYWINIDIAPRAKQSISELLIKAASINPKGLLNEGQAITKFDNLEIYIDKRADDVIHGMHIYQKADEKSPSVAMHSERVTMDFSPEKKILTLNLINPLITTQEEGSISQSVTMDEMPLSINLDKSRSRRIKANRFTNREIREALDTPGYLDKKQTTEFATELPRRASFSLACIVFALIGVPLAINTRRKDTSTGFALGILIASLYFLALIFADLSRKNDTMLPYILLWLPNIITVAVALHLHKRARHKG